MSQPLLVMPERLFAVSFLNGDFSGFFCAKIEGMLFWGEVKDVWI